MKSVSPPPGVSAVQQRADRDRFRVEPGRIENYTIGKGSLAQQESYKVSAELAIIGVDYRGHAVRLVWKLVPCCRLV